MALFGSQWFANAGADTFSVDNSAMFNDDDSEYLTFTPASAGNQRTWTFSFWTKLANIDGRKMFFGQNNAYISINENSSTSYLICLYITGVDSPGWYWETTAMFRDPHAWYHIVVAFDSPNATTDSRLRMYVNGEELTTFTKHATGAQNNQHDIGGTSAMLIAKHPTSSGQYYDGYLAEYVYVNGRQLGPTSFGEKDSNGVWRPIDVINSLSSNATQLLVDRTSGTAIGDMTDSTAGNNLAAAFDGTFGGNDGANNATKRGSVANAFVGKNWGSGVSKIITGFSTRDVNNAGYFDNTAEGRFFLYGSNSAPSAYNDGTLLYSGAAFSSTVSAQSKDFLDTENFDTSTAFQYHWIALVPTSTASDVRMAELILYEDAGNFGTNGFYLPFSNSAELGVGAGPASSTAATVSFLQFTRDSGTSTNYTFSSQNLGTAASDRIIAVHVASERSSAGARTVGSLTVAGVSAALVVRNTSPNGDTHELWEAQVPTGTSGDVVVNHSGGTMTGSAIALYAIYNAQYQQHYTVTDTGTTLSQTLVIPNNSIAIAGASDVDADIGTGNFTGVTERFDQAIDVAGSRAMAGGDTSTDSGTGATTIAFSGASSTSTDDAMFAAVWFPSDGPNNFLGVNSPTQTSDSPTKNYVTLSPLSQQSGNYFNGNTKVTSGADQGLNFASFPVTTGQKVYIEATCSGATSAMTGCVKATAATTRDPSSDFDGLAVNDGRLLHVGLGDVFNSDTSAHGSAGLSAENYAPNDSVPVTHMIALDLVNDKIYWGDAGVGASGWSNGSGSFNQTFDNAVGVDLEANLDWFFTFRPFSATIEVNFGATAFTVSPPTGYSSGYSAAIENENRATALTIEDGSAHVQATAYSGNTSQDHAILQTESLRVPVSTFRPDFCWFARRDSGDSRNMYDSVRGVTSRLYSNGSTGQSTTAITTHLKTFDAAGFTVGSDGAVNGTSMVCWNWKGAGAAPTQTYTVKVVSDSGNKYRFDDFGTSAVTLDLQEGGTYTFDQSDSSNSSHPLRFSTTSDGSHGGGSEYTTGVTTTGTPGSSGAKTVITVAASAPALYYYCSSHSGMGGAANTNDTFGSSNFSGTIQSKVCANPTAGFSIVTYTGNATSGATVGHGLSVAPSMVHYKRLDQNESWISFVSNIGGGKHVYLNLGNGEATASNVFNNTAPGASVLTIGDANSMNATGEAFIAYCFSEIPGYCKAGSFIGNNSTNGPFIELGFSPAIVLVKKTSSSTGGEWYVVDSSRDIENVADNELVWSGANAEDGDQSADHLDFLSNGFKMRCSGAGSANSDDCTTFYMAWAENPFAGTTIATARK